MKLLLMKYRRQITTVIVVVLALILSKIYFDLTKSTQNKLLDGEIKIEYTGKEMTFNTFKEVLKNLDENVRLKSASYDFDFDGINETIIWYQSKTEKKFYIIRIENKNKAKAYLVDVNLDTLKVDGMYENEVSIYSRITFDAGKVYNKNVLYRVYKTYISEGKNVTEDEYYKKLDEHKSNSFLRWKNV